MERCDKCESIDVELVRESSVGGWGDRGRPPRTDRDYVCQSCGHEQRRTTTSG